MDLELKDTVIVGAAHGIGHACASAFAAEGAHVACVDRDENIAAIAADLAHSVELPT